MNKKNERNKNIKKNRKVNILNLDSIQKKLILYFSTIILIALLLVGFVSIYISKEALTNKAEESLLIAAEDAATLMDSRIEIQTHALSSIALNDSINEMDWERQQPELIEQVKNSDLTGMAIVDLEGTAYFDDGVTRSLSGFDYIENSLNGSETVSDLLIDGESGKMSIAYAVPILQNKNVVGALVGYRDASILSENTDDTGRGSDGYGYIINRNGTVVGHPDRELV